MMNPWLILGVVLAVLAAAGAGYGKGRVDGTAACEQRIAEMVKDSQERKDKEAVKANTASGGLEKDNAKTRTVYKTITQTVDKIVERPVYRNVCLDDDGLRSANAALAGALTPAGEPDSTLPKPDPAGGRRGGDGAAQTGGGG